MSPTGTGTSPAARGGVLSQSLWEQPGTSQGCCLPWELCHRGPWAPPCDRCIPLCFSLQDMLSFSPSQGFGAANGSSAKGAAVNVRLSPKLSSLSLCMEPPESSQGPKFYGLAQNSSLDLDFTWTA